MHEKMENKKPLISVIVPCYNHENYVTQCIESIMNQTFTDFELIVIDDGSKDNSPTILKELQQKYGFQLILQQNQGVSATLNKALKEFAFSKYVTFCASDDYWTLDKLQLQFDFMEKHPHIPMCYGKNHYMDEESKVLEKYDGNNNILKGGRIFDDIFTFTLHPAVTYFYKRNLFEEIGYYNASIFAEDYYMNLKIASKYEIGFIDEYLGYYRVDSNTAKVIRFDKVADSHLMSIEGYKDHPLYEKAKRLVYLRKFETFAPFKEHKKRAVHNAFKSSKFLFTKRYIFSLIKLVIFWK